MPKPKKSIAPVHPGESLREDFMAPLGLSIQRLATELSVPGTRIHAIVHGRRGISADTALRLSRYFGTTAQFWMNLQLNYDLECASDLSGESIADRIQPYRAA